MGELRASHALQPPYTVLFAASGLMSAYGAFR